MTTRPLVRGDIVLVPFPFTDLSSAKLRPAAVVGIDTSHQDLIVAFISSNLQDRSVASELNIFPTHPEFPLTGLRVPSRLRATKLATLAAGVVKRWLGRLGPLLGADLDLALVMALSINTVPFREEGRAAERSRLQALARAGGTTSLLADLEP